MTNIYKTLAKIQLELKVPKNQKAKHYNYRSCEDICEGLKLVLKECEASVIIRDEIVTVGERFYVKSTATLYVGDESVEASAYARESLCNMAMSESQSTGSASSFSRKYALNGLFLIDDTKDDDFNRSQDDESEPVKTKTKPEPAIKPPRKFNNIEAVMDAITECYSPKELMRTYEDAAAQFEKDTKSMTLIKLAASNAKTKIQERGNNV